MDSILSTASVAPARRADYWEEMVSRQFVPARCTPGHGTGFTARIRSRSLDALTLCEVASDGTEVLRSAPHIAASPGQYFLLSLQLHGLGQVEQQGRSARLAPGDMALYDTARPYRLRFAAEQRQLVLRLPRAALLARSPQVEARVGLRLAGDDPAARLLRDWSQQLAALDTLPSAQSLGAIAGALMDLVADTLAGHPAEAAAVVRGAPRLAEARRLADGRLDDPSFTVAHWAQALSISERYLRLLFAAASETPVRYLWRSRLARAAERLQAGGDEASITAIALGCGFSDSAHFSRAFRAAYGLAPRDYRQRGRR